MKCDDAVLPSDGGELKCRGCNTLLDVATVSDVSDQLMKCDAVFQEAQQNNDENLTSMFGPD